MKKKKIKGALLISLGISIIYVFFFPHSTARELVLIPAWVIDLDQEQGPGVPLSATDTLIPFKLKDKFGYVNQEGKLYYKDSLHYDVALSTRGFINYSSVQNEDQSLVFFSPDGEFISSYQQAGYPLLSTDGQRLFLLSANGTGISECDESGNILWQASFTKQITCAAVSADLICLGFANGLFQVYNQKGQSVYEISPAKSRISIILGCALNREGNKMAFVYGIEPQYLVYIEKGEKKYANPLYYEMATDFRREVCVKFSATAEHLFVDNGTQLLNYNLKTHKAFLLPLGGIFQSLAVSTAGNLFTVISGDDEHKTLQVFKSDTMCIITDKFTATHIFHTLVDSHLILGLDNNLLCMDLKEL